MPFHAIGPNNFFYESRGSRASPLVFVHGFPAMTATGTQLRFSHKHRVVSCDLCGEAPRTVNRAVAAFLKVEVSRGTDRQASAMTSISMSASLGSSATATVERAGFAAPK